ncbi:hypothetical protein JVU11DRAFT_12290 [Chiua virens]|nr:hypothetical protein JVU11DRAFT_12290 [Chiua virens]
MPSLIEVHAAWLFVKQWASDTISFLDLEKELLTLGNYDYNEWKEIFQKVEVASDPTEDHLISAVDIVLEEARVRGISLSDQPPSNIAVTDGSSFPVASRSRRLPSEPKSRKRRRIAVNRFLDLDATEEEEEEEETNSEPEDEISVHSLRSSQRHIGRSGVQTLTQDLNDIADRYAGAPRSHRVASQGQVEDTRCYFVEFYTLHAARFILEDLKPRVSGALIIPWLPRRVYIRASCPLEIRRALNPSHRILVGDITLVPPSEANQIFSAGVTLPRRSWVQIRRGAYKSDLGYVLNCNGDTADVLVVPRKRPYDLCEEKSQNTRALFDWQTAHEVGLQLIAIENSKGVTAFQCQDISYFAGLLRLSLMTNELERVAIPHPEEFLLHAQAGIDPSLVEESSVLFSSQFWVEGDVVRSSSPELLGQRATVVSVDVEKWSISLLLDNETYHCALLEQRRLFSLGDHVRIVVGPHRGFVGMVTTVLEDEVVLSSATDLSREVQISNFYLETFRPDHQWSSYDPSHPLPSVPPSEEQAALDVGDWARVVDGPHCGLRGYICWIDTNTNIVQIAVPGDPNDHQPEDPEYAGLTGDMAFVHVSHIVSTPASNTLKFTKEKGYDVTVGDEVRIARGTHWGNRGVVKKVDWFKGRLDVMFYHGVTDTVPITRCVKVADFSMRESSKLIGKEVWVIRGQFKGRRATLYALGRDCSVVSLPGHPSVNLPNRYVTALSGVLLSGHMLDQNHLRQLMSLFRASFRASFAPMPRERTPPPSPGASSSSQLAEDSAWMVTPSDVPVTAQLHSQIPWLFNDEFCKEFSSFHLAFNVDLHFERGSFLNRVARTTCPDRFCGPSGPAPEGSVSVTVPGHNRGSGIQHHFIPAQFLKPALPTGSGNDRCALILVGTLAGQIHPITKYRSRKKEVELMGTWFSCADICPAYPLVR